jgi:uncharacterized membrane protein YraQ (UPF0718 family)
MGLFTLAYGKAIWKALVVALVVAAAVDALVPRRRLVAVLSRRGRFGGSVAGGLLSIPCMMCTCCTAPIAGTLRRSGAPTSSVLAYWLGNPTLNPAVLAFLAIVAPWQWFATRLIVGILLVFGVTVVVDRVTRNDDTPPPTVVPSDETDESLRTAPRRFAATLGRLSLTLVPEYAVVVFAVGVFQGWLFPLDAHALHWGILAVVLAAVLGTLVVIFECHRQSLTLPEAVHAGQVLGRHGQDESAAERAGFDMSMLRRWLESQQDGS